MPQLPPPPNFITEGHAPGEGLTAPGRQPPRPALAAEFPHNIVYSCFPKWIYNNRQVKASYDFITFKSCLFRDCRFSSLSSSKHLEK